MKNIFNDAFKKYTIHENRMLRYAGRRRRKEELIKYLKPISAGLSIELHFGTKDNLLPVYRL